MVNRTIPIDLDILKRLPKTDLHLHLDGSLPVTFIKEISEKRGIPLPCHADELRNFLFQMKDTHYTETLNRQNNSGNWPNFDFCNQFLQSAEDLEAATELILIHLVENEHVWLAELRFCPVLHGLKGLSPDEAVVAVVNGVERVKKRHPNFVGGVIVCGLRSYPPEHMVEMAELAARFRGRGVVGFDVAGDEGNYPLTLHKKGLQRAIELGVPTTCHAGEFIILEGPNSTIENIRLAVACGVKRIGHGITLVKEKDLMREVAEKQIVVECCMTGNVGRKVKSYAEHPIREMFDSGVRVCLNCDNLFLSGDANRQATPSGEVWLLVKELKFTLEEVKVVLLNAVRGTFCEVSQEWKDRFEEEIDLVMRSSHDLVLIK